jgi:hypothetical protein
MEVVRDGDLECYERHEWERGERCAPFSVRSSRFEVREWRGGLDYWVFSFEESGSLLGIEEVVGPSVKALGAEVGGVGLDGFLGGEVCGILWW